MAQRLSKQVKKKWFSFHSIRWAYFSLLLSLSIFCIATAYSLFGVYASIGGRMLDIDPHIVLNSALILGGFGFLLLITTVGIGIYWLFSNKKDPIEQGIEDIQEGIKSLQREVCHQNEGEASPVNKKMSGIGFGIGVGVIVGVIVGLLFSPKGDKGKP